MNPENNNNGGLWERIKRHLAITELVTEMADSISITVAEADPNELIVLLPPEPPSFDLFDQWGFSKLGEFEKRVLEQRMQEVNVTPDQLYDSAIKKIMGKVPYTQVNFINQASAYYTKKFENEGDEDWA